MYLAIVSFLWIMAFDCMPHALIRAKLEAYGIFILYTWYVCDFHAIFFFFFFTTYTRS